MINDLQFSDLYLSDNRYSLKRDGQVSVIDQTLEGEVGDLFKRVLAEYKNSGRNEFSIEHDEQRYRAVVFESISGNRAVLRKIHGDITPWNRLGFPKYYLRNLLSPSIDGTGSNSGGLILIAGRPDSGKSTTCYSLINEILTRNPWACMTIEDPVETILPDLYDTGAWVTQLETPSRDFSSALRRALRANKDLIMVGEIRDSYGAQLAIEGAQTGHLVITTLHATDIPNALDRFTSIAGNDEGILDVFSEVFRGCIWQKLEKRHGLANRTLSCQSLFTSKAVASRLKNRGFQQLNTEIDKQKIQLEQEAVSV